jgi:hypothetical protein
VNAWFAAGAMRFAAGAVFAANVGVSIYNAMNGHALAAAFNGGAAALMFYLRRD